MHRLRRCRKAEDDMKNVEKLLDLIRENPDLPVIPLVDSEVVADDGYSYWLGKWGTAEITEYYLGRELLHLKSDDAEDVLSDMQGCRYGRDRQGRDIYDLSDEEWTRLYESLPWKKAIAVHITV